MRNNSPHRQIMRMIWELWDGTTYWMVGVANDLYNNNVYIRYDINISSKRTSLGWPR